MKEKEKKIINRILPLSIGLEVYVRWGFQQEWLKGKIIDRFYSKRDGWYYLVKVEGLRSSRFVTIENIKLKEEDKV